MHPAVAALRKDTVPEAEKIRADGQAFFDDVMARQRQYWRYHVYVAFKSRTTQAAFAAAMKHPLRRLWKRPQGGNVVTRPQIATWLRNGWMYKDHQGKWALTVTGANMYLFWKEEYGGMN